MQFLIKNSNVVLNDKIKKLNILTNNEKIEAIGETLTSSSALILDCKNQFLLPGLTDMHVHLREPGFCQKETIETGCKAAAAGGFSTICCMPNTKPVIDCSEVFDEVFEKSKNCCAKVYIISAITKSLAGKQLIDFAAMSKKGAIAFSDDGRCVENSNLMEQALLEAKLVNSLIVSHCENSTISKGGLLNEGKVSKALNLKGISNKSESCVVSHHIELAKKLNCKLHIAHVSTKESVLAIKKAKQEGVKISAETCPHYFMLNENELISLNANFKINPPLRSEEDRKMVEQAVIDGTIDCIVTDHAPHSEKEKQNFLTAPSGAIGLETSLACTLTHFFHTKKLGLTKIVELMAKKPCEILNLKFEQPKPGSTANFSIVDLNKKWTVDPSKFKSKSRNCPFANRTLKGKVLKTFFKGELVFDESQSDAF